RVDIGLFVSNGSAYSAPGFVTVYSLDSEARTYDRDGKLIEIGYGTGEARLTVSDWNALFDALAREPEGLAFELLHKAFRPEERAATTKVAEEYRAASAKLTAARDKAKKANETKQKAAADMKAADDTLKAAQKTHAAKPSAETRTKVKAALDGKAEA